MLPPLMVGLVRITLYVIAAVAIFRVPLRGSLVLATVGIGLFISSLCATQQQPILGAFLFVALATLLSGYATPIENMPGWLQTATMVNPLRHFLVVTRGVFLKAMPLAEVVEEHRAAVLHRRSDAERRGVAVSQEDGVRLWSWAA